MASETMQLPPCSQCGHPLDPDRPIVFEHRSARHEDCPIDLQRHPGMASTPDLRAELLRFAAWLLADEIGAGHEEQIVDRYLAKQGVVS